MNPSDLIRPIAQRVNQLHPELARVNTKATCFDLLRQTREIAGPEWAYIGKTAIMDGSGKYAPEGFSPFDVEVKRDDGQRQTIRIVAVSMDALWYLPTMTQVKVIVNSTDGEPGGAGKPARLDSYDIARFNPETGEPQYRWHNPPVDPARVSGGVIPQPLPVPVPPSQLEFPPRDLVGVFFAELNQKYQERGAANRVLLTESEHDALYVNNEGIFVWVSEFLRRYATGDHAPSTSNPRDRAQAATEAVMADIDKVK